MPHGLKLCIASAAHKLRSSPDALLRPGGTLAVPCCGPGSRTTCLPSSQAVLDVHRKNCEPLVFGPALAMDRMPAAGPPT